MQLADDCVCDSLLQHLHTVHAHHEQISHDSSSCKPVLFAVLSLLLIRQGAWQIRQDGKCGMGTEMLFLRECLPIPLPLSEMMEMTPISSSSV